MGLARVMYQFLKEKGGGTFVILFWLQVLLFEAFYDAIRRRLRFLDIVAIALE